MRKLVVQSMVTLDGVMQAPGGPEEDSSGGFAFGGWSFPYFDEALGEWVDEAMGKPFDVVLGRRTYEIFAAHWPHDEGPVADRLNEATKHVASRTLDRLEWRNAVLLEGDVVDAVRRLKQEDGPELQVHGSAGLLQTLLAADVVDELRIAVFPLVVGSGKRLFEGGAAPSAFVLASTASSPSGVVTSVYRREGEVRTGSFALEQPSERELERRAGAG